MRLKNLQEVGGVSLVRRAVTVVQAAGLVDVTVATDHPLIALEALRCKYDCLIIDTHQTKHMKTLNRRQQFN